MTIPVGHHPSSCVGANDDDDVSVASLSSSSSSASMSSSVSQQQQQQTQTQTQQTTRNSTSSNSHQERPTEERDVLSLSKDGNQQRSTISKRRVAFHDTVQWRNHIHVTEYTLEETKNAFLQQSDYISMHKTNSKIIQRMKKLHNKKQKEQTKKAAAEKKKNEQKKTKKQNQTSKRRSITSNSTLKKKNNNNQQGDMFQYLHQKQEKREQRQRLLDTTTKNDVSDDDEEEQQRLEERCCDDYGYSLRGLEKETRPSRRKVQEQIYLKAKCLVLSIQEDLQKQSQILQQQQVEEDSDTTSTDTNRKKNDDRRRDPDVPSLTTPCRVAASVQETSQESTQRMAQRYQDICHHHVDEARERGIRDARIVQQMQRMPIRQQQQQKENNSRMVTERRRSATSAGSTAAAITTTRTSSSLLKLDLRVDNTTSSSKSQYRITLAKTFLLFRRGKLSSPSSSSVQKNETTKNAMQRIIVAAAVS